jgi:hypothetical protein
MGGSEGVVDDSAGMLVGMRAWSVDVVEVAMC